jgi:dTDP-4-amino-4,6-dideoxy-D-galactose acyltransferase
VSSIVDAPCERLPWDTDLFGLAIGRVTTNRLEPSRIPAVEAWCGANRIDCLYYLADGAPPATTAAAEAAGFRLVDVRMTLAAPTARPASPVTTVIRPAREDDVGALREIARVSHRDSRFYRDGRFDVARCDALYETWIEKSVHGWAAAVHVAEVDGAVAGYVTCERPAPADGRIGLFAVAEGLRGRGIGRALVGHALAWFAGEGLATVSVVTQGMNVDAQRLYQACGFRTRSVQLWYHRWSGA